MYHYLGNHKHTLLRILLLPTQLLSCPPSVPVSYIHHPSKFPFSQTWELVAGRWMLPPLLPLPAPPPGGGGESLPSKARTPPSPRQCHRARSPASSWVRGAAWGGASEAAPEWGAWESRPRRLQSHHASIVLACQALRVRLLGRDFRSSSHPPRHPPTLRCPPARPSPGSARAFQDNSGLVQHVCFHEVGDLACAAPLWATMSVPHTLTGSAEVTNLSWVSVSTSVWWERHHPFLPCFLLCFTDQDFALLGPAEWVPEEWVPEEWEDRERMLA